MPRKKKNKLLSKYPLGILLEELQENPKLCNELITQSGPPQVITKHKVLGESLLLNDRIIDISRDSAGKVKQVFSSDMPVLTIEKQATAVKHLIVTVSSSQTDDTALLHSLLRKSRNI